MYLPAESFDALHYKEIPPNQIEMSPSRFLECGSYPFRSQLIEVNDSEFLEDGESGSSESESESDSSETEPDMDENITSHSGCFLLVLTLVSCIMLGRLFCILDKCSLLCLGLCMPCRHASWLLLLFVFS